MLILVFTVLGSLAISFLCSIAEAVILSVQHAQIEALGKSRAAEILREFKREIDIPIAAIVSFHTVAHTIGASVCGAMYVHAMGDSTLWVFSLTFTLAVRHVRGRARRAGGLRRHGPRHRAQARLVGDQQSREPRAR